MSDKKQYIIFLFFLTISFAMRLFSFFPSILDHDESTYLIIGRDILNGKLLYTDVTDTKPVGIFLFYAGLEFLFGSSIFLKRMVFSLVVGATAFLIFRASKKLFNQNKVAFASGLIYIIYTSIWTYHGRSPNTELLFNLCTISALLFFLTKDIRSYFVGGLLMGIGFIIKYLVLFDLAAFLLFFFILEITNLKSKPFWLILWKYIVASFAFLLPFGLVNLYFWLGVNFQNFYFITYELTGNYGNSPSFIRYFTMLLDFIAKFLPISFIVFYVIFKRIKPMEKSIKWFFAVWLFFVLFAIYIPGKEFSHYTIQLMLPLSLLAGVFFHSEFKTDRITSAIYSKKIGLGLMIIILLAIQIVSFNNEVNSPDYPNEVAIYLEDKLEKDDKVFVSNYEQIIYYLLSIESPTKFVHSNLLFTETHKAFNINAADEVKRIIDTKPKFILIQRQNLLVAKLIKRNYQLIKKFKNGEVLIYQLKS